MKSRHSPDTNVPCAAAVTRVIDDRITSSEAPKRIFGMFRKGPVNHSDFEVINALDQINDNQ